MNINWNTKETWIHRVNKRKIREKPRWNFSSMCSQVCIWWKKSRLCYDKYTLHRRKLRKHVRKWDSECNYANKREKWTQSFRTPTFLWKVFLPSSPLLISTSMDSVPLPLVLCLLLLPVQTPLITLSNPFVFHCICPISFQTNRTCICNRPFVTLSLHLICSITYVRTARTHGCLNSCICKTWKKGSDTVVDYNPLFFISSCCINRYMYLQLPMRLDDVW